MAKPQRKKTPDLDSAWHRARTCSICGGPYVGNRCNSYAGWDELNPGHRDGNHKTKVKVCHRCQPPKATQRVLNLAQLGVVRGKRTA